MSINLPLKKQNKKTQRQFKTGGPQGGVLSPTLFNIYTSDTPTPQAPAILTTYADDITITSTHKYTTIPTGNTYMVTNQQSHSQSRQNNMHSLQIRSSGIQHTTCTTNRQHHTPHEHQPKILGITLDPKLRYNKHIENTTNTQKTQQKHAQRKKWGYFNGDTPCVCGIAT